LESPYDLIIVGGGPAGYVGAIRAAQLGMKVGLVEEKKVGGTCLHEGCIPTKVLLEVAGFMNRAGRSEEFGVRVEPPVRDPDGVMRHRDSIVNRLYQGVQGLLKKNGVETFNGKGALGAPGSVSVMAPGVGMNVAGKILKGQNILLATGSRPRPWPGLPFGEGPVFDSTAALSFDPQGKKVGIVGGGVVGVEFADIFRSFGGDVALLEREDHLIPSEDPDIADLLRKEYERRGIEVLTGCRIVSAQRVSERVRIQAERDGIEETREFDAVLVSIGRSPNLEGLGLEKVPLSRTGTGFLKVDEVGWTGTPGIYAAGDLTGGPMLAHFASHQAIVSVEHIAGKNPVPVDPLHVPRVIYCHPEIASVGLTLREAEEKGIDAKEGRFPLLGNGRSLIHGDRRGLVKVVANPKNGQILGFQGIGPGVSEMIAILAYGMGDRKGIFGLLDTVFPHPTVSEAIWEAGADVFGRAIHR
jgi:dihydrolipoamide dehydrogenase